VAVIVPFPVAVIALLLVTIVREQRAKAARLLAERADAAGPLPGRSP
jgi:hypothetical protein